MKGLIVYNADALRKNGFFADKLQSELAALDVETEIVTESEAENAQADFAVMRVYNEALNGFFDRRGIKTFNNSLVASVCNDKWKTYEFLKKNGLPIAPTQKAESCGMPFPRVVKARHGHGGSEVFWANDEYEYKKIVSNMTDSAIAQPPVGKKGRDLRVYVVGGKPIVAMLRKSDVDFRSNFSLGGSAERYELTKEENSLIERISSLFEFDFAGIDFLLTESGLICNEIEDVVGCRMVYKYTDIDIIKKYAEHINSSLKHLKIFD